MTQQLEFIEHAEQALATAKKLGASHASISASLSQGFDVSVRQGEIEALVYHDDQDFQVTLWRGNRVASCYTNQFNELESLCQIAYERAAFTEEDPHQYLPDSSTLAWDVPNFQLSESSTLSPKSAHQAGVAIEQAIHQIDQQLIVDEITVATQKTDYWLANSHGFLSGYQSHNHQLSATVMAESQGKKQRDGYYAIRRSPTALPDVKEVGEQAATAALARLGSRRIATQQCAVVFSPRVAPSVLATLAAGLSGSAIYRRASFLIDRLNQPITTAALSIHEMPHAPCQLGSAPFDLEGVLTQPRCLIDQGTLGYYLHSSYSARQCQTQSTGHAGGAHTWIVSHQHTVPDVLALCEQMGEGLLVTELMGQGVDLVTGQYSKGVSGFWVSGGKIQFPVSEVTVADNLNNLYQNIEAISEDYQGNSAIQVGGILVKSMTVAGE